ncbi:hypothetical protein JW905_01280 [bacterium]|nr:hypothetical protein [candidate division CSSED10-310 bacterium]
MKDVMFITVGFMVKTWGGTRRLLTGWSRGGPRSSLDGRALDVRIARGVESALERFNIPTCEEVGVITRSLERLSGKIERILNNRNGDRHVGSGS